MINQSQLTSGDVSVVGFNHNSRLIPLTRHRIEPASLRQERTGTYFAESRPCRTKQDSVHSVRMDAATPSLTLSVIMPIYNEAPTLTQALQRVIQAPFSKEIIVVDDGSTDGSRELLQQLAADQAADAKTRDLETASYTLRVFFHPHNEGKGAAIRTALRAITSANASAIVVIQDADLEYDPAEYPQLLGPILSGQADVVYGSRFLGSPRRVMFFWHALGNSVLTLLSNMLTNLNLTDMQTGYKAFRTELVTELDLRSNRFGFEPEITAKVARRRVRIYEVPISYTGRTYAEGKKINWQDGLSAVWTILRYNLIDDTSPAGEKTLRRISDLSRYNAWLWEIIAPFTGQRVLEVGAGLGTMTRYFLNKELIVSTELEPLYLERLRDAFGKYPNVLIHPLNLDDGIPPWLPAHRVDTVLCLNVLEHIEDDEATLQHFFSILPSGGRVVLIVPALKLLYGTIDQAISHYRRYEHTDIVQKLQRAGFQVEKTQFFNVLGILGWYLNSCVFKRQSVPRFQARVNDFLVPLLRLEQYCQPPWGMSLLAVGKKEEEGTKEERSPTSR